MSSSGSSYGDIHRYEPARESTAAAIAIVLLTVIEVVFVFLFVYGLMFSWASTEFGNMFMGAVLALIFLDLAFILVLYRKEFPPRCDDREEASAEVGGPLHQRGG